MSDRKKVPLVVPLSTMEATNGLSLSERSSYISGAKLQHARIEQGLSLSPQQRQRLAELDPRFSEQFTNPRTVVAHIPPGKVE